MTAFMSARASLYASGLVPRTRSSLPDPRLLSGLLRAIAALRALDRAKSHAGANSDRKVCQLLRRLLWRPAFLQKVCPVPSLFRFLTILAVLGALAYGIMFALVTFVSPEPREMTQTISPTKLNK